MVSLMSQFSKEKESARIQSENFEKEQKK